MKCSDSIQKGPTNTKNSFKVPKSSKKHQKHQNGPKRHRNAQKSAKSGEEKSQNVQEKYKKVPQMGRCGTSKISRKEMFQPPSDSSAFCVIRS